MIDQLRSELLKLRTTRTTATLLLAAGALIAFGAGFAILAARDVDLALTGADALAIALGTIAASALSAMIGVALGALVRNQAGAIIALVAYAVAVDAGLFAALPSIGRFLPGKAGDALAGRAVDDLLAPGIGAAVLAAWTLAFVVAASVRNDRTDV
jgi:ABC-2 type transport system permease protein